MAINVTSANEKWRAIKGYKGMYVISNTGKIKSLARLILDRDKYHKSKEKILKTYTEQKGYLAVELHKNNIGKKHKIHRLVINAFKIKPAGLVWVNHKDGNKQNNNINNLEWVTAKQNVIHAFKNNIRHFKFTPHEVKAIRNIGANNITERKYLAKIFGTTAAYIREILDHRRWKFI